MLFNLHLTDGDTEIQKRLNNLFKVLRARKQQRWDLNSGPSDSTLLPFSLILKTPSDHLHAPSYVSSVWEACHCSFNLDI